MTSTQTTTFLNLVLRDPAVYPWMRLALGRVFLSLFTVVKGTTPRSPELHLLPAARQEVQGRLDVDTCYTF